jgi:hypothetical protein
MGPRDNPLNDEEKNLLQNESMLGYNIHYINVVVDLLNSKKHRTDPIISTFNFESV